MPSSRRRFLTTSTGLVAATLGSLAGCVGAPESGSPESTDSRNDDQPTTQNQSSTPTEPPADSRKSVGGVSVAVTGMLARKAVVYTSAMGSGGVVVEPGKQYVVAGVTAGAGIEANAFSFENGEQSWPVSELGERGGIPFGVAGHDGGLVGSPIGQKNEFVAFEVDSPLDPDNPRIRCDHGGESAVWSLPDEAVSTLSVEAPTFELDSWEAPDEIRQGETMDVSLSVTNTSEVAGRFLAALYWPTELVEDDDESTIVEEQVDAGASTTLTATIDTRHTTYEDGPQTLEVEGHVEASKEIRVTDAGTDR